MHKTTLSDLEQLFGSRYRSGVYWVDLASPEETVKQAAQNADLMFFHLDGQMIHSKVDFFNVCVRELQFPYFGFNLNALNDCLKDMSWFSEPLGFALLYNHVDVFIRSEGGEQTSVTKVLERATEFRRKKAKRVKPMYVLLTTFEGGRFMPLLGQDV